jgi:ribosomal protein L40E
MSVEGVEQPQRRPAGWYFDPFGRTDARFWDGSVWTTRTQVGGDERTDPVGERSDPADDPRKNASSVGVEREPCTRCGELIPATAQVCRFCGNTRGPSYKEFLGIDLTNLGPERRMLNIIGFTFLGFLVVWFFLRFILVVAWLS